MSSGTLGFRGGFPLSQSWGRSHERLALSAPLPVISAPALRERATYGTQALSAVTKYLNLPNRQELKDGLESHQVEESGCVRPFAKLRDRGEGFGISAPKRVSFHTGKERAGHLSETVVMIIKRRINVCAPYPPYPPYPPYIVSVCLQMLSYEDAKQG